MPQISSTAQRPQGIAPANTVRRYYQLVDDGDISGVIQLFEPTAEYLRPGYEKLTGHVELERFYRDERIIESGRHTIGSLIAADLDVAVRGEFHGILRDGREASLEFADFFTLTESGTFAKRQTFFYAPLV
ncbi:MULTISPECIES: nuclear transport factor 2 family protein [Streptomyces violaceusniger group]|uniref:Nuclear transport factor 2 family protein n=2 Tax=Streptomyces rhizosphaericus TaxID=114699 RepID=A0ABN1PFT8_9ACTN|nr:MULTISPECIES: nuclear transport factor 2 family protein [Streptomyces violaceusniger group]